MFLGKPVARASAAEAWEINVDAGLGPLADVSYVRSSAER